MPLRRSRTSNFAQRYFHNKRTQTDCAFSNTAHCKGSQVVQARMQASACGAPLLPRGKILASLLFLANSAAKRISA